MSTDFKTNAFKHAIAAGKLQIGLWSSLCSNIAADIIGDSGFDWILLDTEHSPNEIPDLVTQLQALAGRHRDADHPPGLERRRARQALPRHRRADAAVSLCAERGGGQTRGRLDALPAARAFAASRSPRAPSATAARRAI